MRIIQETDSFLLIKAVPVLPAVWLLTVSETASEPGVRISSVRCGETPQKSLSAANDV